MTTLNVDDVFNRPLAKKLHERQFETTEDLKSLTATHPIFDELTTRQASDLKSLLQVLQIDL